MHKMTEWINFMETNFIIRPRSRKRRRRKKEMTNKVNPRTAASTAPQLAIKNLMWPKYNLLRIKYMMMNLIMKLITCSIIIRIQKNKTQIIPGPIRIQNVIEQFRRAHIFLVRILRFIVKFSLYEKTIKFFAIFLMVLTFNFVNVKTMKKIAQIFYGFSEKLNHMNFNFSIILIFDLWQPFDLIWHVCQKLLLNSKKVNFSQHWFNRHTMEQNLPRLH